MKRLVDDEDLNLQDLIFILLFFFIIAQTLIVFKMETDVIVLPKVDDRIKKDPDEDKDLITILIDHKSTVTALIAKTGRDTLVKGLEKHEREEVLLYCDPTEGKDEFLKSEKSDAYKEIVDKIKQIKEAAHFSLPQLGLIADHRARYGTIFQVNMAVKTLIDEEEVDRTVKWKVREEGAGIDDEDLPALLETAPEGA